MPQTAFILIVTEQQERGQRLRDVIRSEHNQPCSVVTRLSDALDSIRQRAPDAVVAETPLDGATTIAPLLELLERLSPEASLVALGEPDEALSPQRVQLTVLPADLDEAELVERIIAEAGRAVDRREERFFRESLDERPIEDFEGIVGTAPQIRRITERIRKAARSKLTVLILGETGTGKDLIARAIHNQSDRVRKPFKAINCAGLTESLLESELFGHTRGAFTGAISDRKGYFVAADGGSLFLDEIGDMPLTMQAKLLRVLDHREVTPVGSTDVVRVDVRLIAATNVNLFSRVEEGKFREDLYYRLKQWVIEVPPLRERRQDIPLLAVHFLRRANEQNGTSIPGFSAEALTYLAKYYWPGNVRELASLIESLAVEVESRRIEVDDLPESIRGSRALVPTGGGSIAGLTMAEIERLAIERTLQATGGNREQAAKMLDIGTRTLYRKLKEYGLQ